MPLIDIDWDEDVYLWGRNFTKAEFLLILVGLSIALLLVGWAVFYFLFTFFANIRTVGYLCIALGGLLHWGFGALGWACGTPLIATGVTLVLFTSF